MRRRTLPAPFRPESNPWTRGLVFFSVLDNPRNLRNWIGPGTGTSTQPAAQNIVTGTAGYPGLTFNDTNVEYIDWTTAGLKPLPSVAGGGVTVIARVKPTLNSGSLGSFFGTWDQVPRNGFMLYYDGDVGSADEGIAFIVGEANSYLLSHAGPRGSYSGYEFTCAGNYNPVTRTTSVWSNGALLDSDTDAGTAWLTTTTSFLQTGVTQDAARYYNGNIYWVACFDRCLTDAEMATWTTADPLALIQGDDMATIRALNPQTTDDLGWSQTRYDFQYIG